MVIRWTQCECDAKCGRRNDSGPGWRGEYICDNSEVTLSEREGNYIYVRNSARREEANLSKREAEQNEERKQKEQEGKT